MTAVLRRRHSAGGVDALESAPLIMKHDCDYESFEEYKRQAHEAALEQTQTRLVALANEKFDLHLESHRAKIVELWTQAFQTPYPMERRSARWSELSFQGQDPVSDLRGAGVLGVVHLSRLIAALGPGYRTAVGEDFPLALASLSVTAMLCKHFGLDRTLVVPGVSEARPDVIRALLVAVQSTERHLHDAADPDVLHALHVSIVRHLASAWRCVPSSEAKIMHFNVALRATFAHAQRVFAAAPTPWSLSSVTSSIEAEGGTDGDAEQSVCTQVQLSAWAVYAVLRLLVLRLGCTVADQQILSETEASGGMHSRRSM